jgi:hypothetical protein
MKAKYPSGKGIVPDGAVSGQLLAISKNLYSQRLAECRSLNAECFIRKFWISGWTLIKGGNPWEMN